MLLGHDGPPGGLWRNNMVTGEPLQRCPRRDELEAPEEMGREVSRMRLEYYPLFRRGHLLRAGGLEDQPALYLDHMTLLDGYERLIKRKLAVTDDDGDSGEDDEE